MSARFYAGCLLGLGWMVAQAGWSIVAVAGVGDPQVATDHTYYPGELACSSFPRLAETQAKLYAAVVGQPPRDDHERALAAWMWRNLHFAHGEEGAQDLWGKGFQASDNVTREYWTGLFAHGFGLCGTTHAQWTAELNALLGHNRSRTVGVSGHNSCEVFLTGGVYGNGRWALLDHDVCSVVMDDSGTRLLSIAEVQKDLKRWTTTKGLPATQQGWPLSGLHPDDLQAFSKFSVAEYLPGYAGPSPMVHLRRGETLRRYFAPGLEDGKTFAYWGRNYRTAGIPGPERSRTWINQPERFRNTPEGSGYRPGQARYGNAIYLYQPNFNDGSYREGVIAEDDESVTFEFNTPYIIAATPADDSDWGIYQPGCTGGLVIRSPQIHSASVSVDRGNTWTDASATSGAIDLTDSVKGHRQYWLKLPIPKASRDQAAVQIKTVCQANPAIFPRLKDGGSEVSYAASGQAIVSAGPTLQQAQPHLVQGAFDTPRVTLQLATPRAEPIRKIYAATHVASSSPPDPNIRYQIEYSVDAAKSWLPLVYDWQIVRQGEEPKDFWSQSFCYGELSLKDAQTGPVQVRFRNDGGKRNLRAEMHLVYDLPQQDACQVTFSWSDDQGQARTASHVYTAKEPAAWKVDTGQQVTMHYVELSAVHQD